MAASIGPVSSKPFYTQLDFSVRAKDTSPTMQAIDSKLNAAGRKSVGQQSFQASLQYLARLFDKKNVQVATSIDNQGLTQVTLTDGDSGKRIAQLPPDAVVAMANRARQQHVGWLVDVVL
ncbi:hypothetical protein TcarDRAFT_0766 [Thermosinus carboxydivorans Nor1]|uniref:Flagellar protein FlaG protein n=1 Tax=Thermosinus carboxydivorans Nor1 TaxID=401526 RepID=A1HT37_9FIRM|nr:flagellar protein FlaG [Thermosinus carboxydivorans]EAX46802.1 hypothetical protein TcarDRAFT_0766 [Thermosinus carboxydivorans Nor1]